MIFTKMNCAGNDYILTNCKLSSLNISEVAIKLSNRHYSIGGDGLVLIDSDANSDFSMRIFNADGSEANMCGTAICCLAKLVYDSGQTTKNQICISTKSGIKRLSLITNTENKVVSVSVNLGIPALIKMGSNTRQFYHVNTSHMGRIPLKLINIGNSHAVAFLDCLGGDALMLAQEISNMDCFEDGINTELAVVDNESHIDAIVYERGSGHTLACGTGAAAIAYAAYTSGMTNSQVKISMQGGEFLVVCTETGIILRCEPKLNFLGEIKSIFD
ncbi:MAG: diaminopimelate epimerase [Christensenellaceae bacterium]|jgi:diaminopimelate epimerase|nr:diaminopimelate epimerase [Christensenellaceae bacterium]